MHWSMTVFGICCCWSTVSVSEKVLPLCLISFTHQDQRKSTRPHGVNVILELLLKWFFPGCVLFLTFLYTECHFFFVQMWADTICRWWRWKHRLHCTKSSVSVTHSYQNNKLLWLSGTSPGWLRAYTFLLKVLVCSHSCAQVLGSLNSPVDSAPFVKACADNMLCHYPDVDDIACLFLEAYAKASGLSIDREASGCRTIYFLAHKHTLPSTASGQYHMWIQRPQDVALSSILLFSNSENATPVALH